MLEEYCLKVNIYIRKDEKYQGESEWMRYLLCTRIQNLKSCEVVILVILILILILRCHICHKLFYLNIHESTIYLNASNFQNFLSLIRNPFFICLLQFLCCISESCDICFFHTTSYVQTKNQQEEIRCFFLNTQIKKLKSKKKLTGFKIE